MLQTPLSRRVLVEQLRLVHTNVPISFLATGFMSLATVWVLSFSYPLMPLLAWCALVWVFIIAAISLSRHYLTSERKDLDAPKTLRLTVLIYTLFGGLWGALPALVLDAGAPLKALLMCCVSAGMLSGGMTFMAPVLPAFIGYALLLIVPIGLKLLSLGEAAYIAVGIGAFIFMLTLLSQAHKTALSFRNMIELRFENVELVEQLHQETQIALAARSEAEQANQAKSKFLAAASHDLRQPIHAQGMFLEVLAQEDLTAHQRKILANARSACAASGEMLNTLLDFSRIEAGVVIPQIQAFALQPLLNNIETELAPQADSKDIVYRSRETHAMVESDPSLVNLILRNLISNAIRYTEKGGVLITCRQRGTNISVEVWDTGIGIATQDQTEIFREFHQLGNPERDRRKGLGLGLAISKGLSSKLGHTLALSSRPGRGSTFRLKLPIALQAPTEDALIGWSSTHPIHISDVYMLVIDDDETVCFGMKALLQSWGCVCDVAETVEEALAYNKRPGLVICDYRLREQRTGAQAIAALRAQYGDAALPALLITGDTAPERLREAQASGLPLLHKPVSPEDLRQKIVKLLNAH